MYIECIYITEYREIFFIALVKGVGNGLVKVITGIKDKDWLKVVSGGLNVIASILVYTGPIGSFIGAILSLISTGLCAFGSKKGLF